MSGPSFGPFILLCLNRGKLHQVNFGLHHSCRICEALHDSPWNVAGTRLGEKFEVVQRHYIPIYPANFL